MIVFAVCLFLVFKRRRRGETIVVPASIGAVALVASILLFVISLVRSLEAVASVNPADKATILAAGISEGLNNFAFWFAIELPLLVAAYFVDRWLRKRDA